MWASYDKRKIQELINSLKENSFKDKRFYLKLNKDSSIDQSELRLIKTHIKRKEVETIVLSASGKDIVSMYEAFKQKEVKFGNMSVDITINDTSNFTEVVNVLIDNFKGQHEYKITLPKELSFAHQRKIFDLVDERNANSMHINCSNIERKHPVCVTNNCVKGYLFSKGNFKTLRCLEYTNILSIDLHVRNHQEAVNVRRLGSSSNYITELKLLFQSPFIFGGGVKSSIEVIGPQFFRRFRPTITLLIPGGLYGWAGRNKIAFTMLHHAKKIKSNEAVHYRGMLTPRYDSTEYLGSTEAEQRESIQYFYDEF